jgi:hypothetical protein
MDGVVFYSKKRLINPCCIVAEKEYFGNDAITAIEKIAAIKNCTIDVYNIDENQVFFWTNVPRAKTLYDNLTTDLTDLSKLLRKVEVEKITGMIEVSIKGETKPSLMLFYQGSLVGTYRPSLGDNLTSDDSVVDYLRGETSTHGGSFCVKTIPVDEVVTEAHSNAVPDHKPDVKTAEILALVAEMIYALESLISGRAKGHDPFALILKKKFIDKVDAYPFLDPFADEFGYGDRKVRFDGGATPVELAHAVGRCVLEIADDYRLKADLEREFSRLREHYPSAMHIFFPDA